MQEIETLYGERAVSKSTNAKMAFLVPSKPFLWPRQVETQSCAAALYCHLKGDTHPSTSCPSTVHM